MIGLVLWCDTNDQKAVFWCEDHGDLAFYDAAQDVALDFDQFSAGDMVQFDVTLDCKTRRARNASIVQQQASAEIQSALCNRAQNMNLKQADESERSQVVQFPKQIENEVSFGRVGTV